MPGISAICDKWNRKYLIMNKIILPKDSPLLSALFISLVIMQLDYTVVDADHSLEIYLTVNVSPADAYKLGCLHGQMIKVVNDAKVKWLGSGYYPSDSP